MGVLALIETKMKGKREVMFGNVRGRISGVEDGQGREGVALLLSEEMWGCVVEWKEVSARMTRVKLRIEDVSWVFVNAYGHGSEKSEKEREEFWSDLNECVESVGRNVNVVLMGDLNARVGDEQVDGVIEKYGVPGRNRSGEKMLEIRMEKKLVVANTVFKKNDVHKYT